ncbi:MAG: biopolymer transporter Tol [Ignavibacteria bacterium]
MIKKAIIFFGLSWLCALTYSNVIAQFEPYPELEWYTIETENFYIHYHKGTERTAQTVAKIAEEVYGPISSLYNHKLKEKANFIVSDVSDIANGATDFYGNRIEIFASALDFDLRGTHNWLRNVVTHEFTHLIQIQSAMKTSQNLPAIYLQWLNYEKERRPDVLYGYPNAIVSYPISGFGVPAWFAEGTAQYQRQQLGYDYWDAHRDMILRAYAIDNKMLSWEEMGQFSSITSLKAESIYNSGFALVQYIAAKYGEDKLRNISHHLGELTNFSVDRAIKQSIGKSGIELYNEWKTFLQNDYKKRLSLVENSKIEGEIIATTGFANYYPHFSPDAKKIAYLSNKNFDYSTTSLFVYDLATKKEEIIAAPVSTNFSWSPDGEKIVYAKRNTPPTIEGVTIFDLYEYSFKTKKERRLTEGLRAYSPAYSNDGTKICFVVNKGGTLNLYISNNDGSNIREITNFSRGEQVYNPRFSPDDKRVYFDYSLEDLRNIAMIDIESGKFEFVFANKTVDTRTPVFNKEGTRMYFASDRTGIFNIYSYELQTGYITQITNVTTGAFMPSVFGEDLVYSHYSSDGYKIAILKNITEHNPDSLGSYIRPDKLVKRYASVDSSGSEDRNKFDWKSLRNFQDTILSTNFKTSKYQSVFTPLYFFPVIRYDNYTKSNKFMDALKPGFYVYSEEVMNRYSIFAGAFLNRNLERDLFLQFTYNNGVPFLKDFFSKKLSFSPKFLLEGYNLSRKADGTIVAGIDSFNVGVTYNLLELDAGFSFPIININHNLGFKYTFSKYSSALDAFVIPSSGRMIPGSSLDYFKASALTIDYSYDFTFGSRNMDINPIGRKIKVQYQYEASKINPEYEVDENNNLISVYTQHKLHKIDASWIESFGLFGNKHSLSTKFRVASIFGPAVEDFYNFYASGLPGMKGYPFYSMGGGRLFTANLTYRFPLVENIDYRLPPLYFDKLYFSIFGDWGNAWDEKDTKLKNFKKDVGFELRLQAFTSYAFPTSIFFSGAYGIDQFTKRFQGQDVTYGKEWRFYFGMLFGFDI